MNDEDVLDWVMYWNNTGPITGFPHEQPSSVRIYIRYATDDLMSVDVNGKCKFTIRRDKFPRRKKAPRLWELRCMREFKIHEQGSDWNEFIRKIRTGVYDHVPEA